jgi:MFS family permease
VTADATAPRVPPLASLAHRDFRLLYIGLLVSMIGTQITRVTSGWLLYEMTGSAAALGIAGLVAALPLIPMSLLGGALADAVERRKLMLAMQGLSLLTIGALAVLTATGLIQPWHIYLSGALMTIAGTLDRPARQALIPMLVPREHLLNAYTLMTTLIQAGSLVGPVIAGVLLSLAGPAVAFGVDALSFLAVVVALLIMHVPPIEGGGRKVSLGSIVDGLRFVFSKSFIVGLFGLDIVAMLFGFYPTLLPVFAADILQVGPAGLGWLVAAPAAGSLLGAGIMLVVGRVHRPGWVMLGAVAGYGAALVGLGWSTWLPLSLLFGALLGLTDAISMAIRHTAMQLETPDEFRGRVSSAMQISVQGGNSIGTLTAGLTAAAIGAGPAAMLGGCLVMGATAVFGWAVPPLRRYRM